MTRGVRDLGDRERRRVRREQHRLVELLPELSEDPGLELHALGDRFDDRLHSVDRRVEDGGAGEVRQGRRARVLGDLATRHTLVEVGLDLGEPACDGLRRDVEEAGLDAARREDVSDAVSHGPGAEDGGAFDGGCVGVGHGLSSRIRGSGRACRTPGGLRAAGAPPGSRRWAGRDRPRGGTNPRRRAGRSRTAPRGAPWSSRARTGSS